MSMNKEKREQKTQAVNYCFTSKVLDLIVN